MFCPDVMRCVQVEAANERARLAAKNILESEESNGTSEFSRHAAFCTTAGAMEDRCAPRKWTGSPEHCLHSMLPESICPRLHL